MTEAVDGLFVAQIAKNNWKKYAPNFKYKKLISLRRSQALFGWRKTLSSFLWQSTKDQNR